MKVEVADVPRQQIDEALAQAKAVLPAETFAILDKIVCAYSTLVEALEGKNTSIRRLRRMLFGPASEKIRTVLAGQEPPQGGGQAPGGGGKAKPPGPPPPGHGRNGVDAYRGAQTERVAHHKLKPGDLCPECVKGKVYEQRNRPKILVRVTGRPPLAAMVYLLQRLRCNLCEKVFPARPPKGAGPRRYDASAASMIGLFKYGGGFPWSRLHKLQGSVGVPLPPSTQWEIVRDAARSLSPAYTELQRQAAQGEVLHNDDTAMKILAWMGKRREASMRERAQETSEGRQGEGPSPNRTGIFTSGIVSRLGERQIALFFTGHRHAGENLKALLNHRDQSLSPPIQMCDALSRNLPENFKTLLANCLAHGRRQFVEQAQNFPRECDHILGVLAKIYKHDAIAKKREMTDAERLRFHQAKSGPLMDMLHAWMQAQLAEKKVEPNSGMGQALGYMLKHWEKLTLFLRKAGAPLDNNICERALKKAILHRKNSLFYKTDNGARVGDVFMSLIHTCDLNGVDPFDYLTQMQRHAKEVRMRPDLWMPWSYRQAIAREPPG
ncbi:MAG: IS66 family transposase [Elusimicrobia bacterium]|nr:IS66 family transposase [Elusimicrobiota bacterium]